MEPTPVVKGVPPELLRAGDSHDFPDPSGLESLFVQRRIVAPDLKPVVFERFSSGWRKLPSKNRVVKKIADFGAFVEILPGTDGLVHISQLADERVDRVTDILQEGDEVWVKVLDVDRQGKIRLSRKDALAEMGGRK